MTQTPENAAQRPYWFVGASFGSTDDQTERFLQEGIWENGWEDKFLDDVKEIQRGDRIAIKACFTQKHKLPFPNPEQNTAGGMYIKAIGVVNHNQGDGYIVGVEWERRFDPPRPWYFNQLRKTIHSVTLGEAWDTDELIDFTFENKPQDFSRFTQDARWQERFGGTLGDTTSQEQNPHEEPDIGKGDEAGTEGLPYSIDDIMREGCFLERFRLEGMLEHLCQKKNLILQGPPGTGKTWLARKLAYALIGQKDDRRVQAVQFHPNLSYEDFIRGWRPAGDGRLELRDGPFLNWVDAARNDPSLDYVLVIEEINRGNPAHIFGEMLTLLEADKRSDREALGLSYRRYETERVFVPPNLYMIGTMNTADRSLALVDLAFRRRFAFEELEPVFGSIWREWVNRNCGIDVASLERIEGRVTDINRQIAEDKSLGRQFCIGHSFVTPPSGSSIQNASVWFDGVVEKEIGPLLDEYWFDSPEIAQQAKSELRAGL